MDKPCVGIVDYGAGNTGRWINTLRNIGCVPVLIRSRSDFNTIDGLVIPGVGSYASASDKLFSTNLWKIVNETISENKPVLGVCLGMQLLTARGIEGGGAQGLKYFSGNSIPISTDASMELCPTLNIGWRKIDITDQGKKDPITRNWDSENYFYFAHSYKIELPSHQILANTKFSSLTFPALVGEGNVYGTQFHPEMSGLPGQIFLKTIFCEI